MNSFTVEIRKSNDNFRMIQEHAFYKRIQEKGCMYEILKTYHAAMKISNELAVYSSRYFRCTFFYHMHSFGIQLGTVFLSSFHVQTRAEYFLMIL